MTQTNRIGKTDNGRTEITTTGEEPAIARSKKRYWDLWKMAKTLYPVEIEMLIAKRKNDLKHTFDDYDEYRDLKTEIKLLEDIYRIVKRKKR